MLEEAEPDATVALMPCVLLPQIGVVGTVAFWTRRCCHVYGVGCNVGRRAALPDAIRVDIAGIFCLG